MNLAPQIDASSLMAQIRQWALELGFSQIAVADIDLSTAEAGLNAWLQAGFHGSMHYMQAHGLKRARPAELLPGTVRVLSVSMPYLPRSTAPGWQALEWQGLSDANLASVSLYARGRDYHKVLRQRLQALVDKMAAAVGPFGHRVFTDSAPVLEVEIASRSGVAWRGKHTLALRRDAGSMFFLGEIFIDFALPLTPPVQAHCGTCQSCINVCPTKAIIAPYKLDARLCISYLTIEHAGSIPLELRPLIGNHLYGCDDCQLICPWNKFAAPSTLADFDTREPFAHANLIDLWSWNEDEFLRRTEGGPIRRIGFERWQRNLAVVSGNALRVQHSHELRSAMTQAHPINSPMVQEHMDWALKVSP